MLRVLLIEDAPSAVETIKILLTAEDLEVDRIALGKEALDPAKLSDYDILLLDLSRSDVHEDRVLKGFRASSVSTPVLILSQTSESASKIRSYRFGADAYMYKPFNAEDLVACIYSVVRRARGHKQSVVRTGKLAVNLETRTVDISGARVHLTSREYAILELLTLKKGETIPGEAFLAHLYGGVNEPEIKMIEIFMCKLRKKLTLACSKDSYIETIWNCGYVLRDPEPQTSTNLAA